MGDTKAACLQTYSDVGHDRDPQPQPPEAFLDPARVQRLCREMQRLRGAGGGVEKQPKDEGEGKPGRKKDKDRRRKKKSKSKRKRPQRLVRTVVATASAEAFGWMVSA